MAARAVTLPAGHVVTDDPAGLDTAAVRAAVSGSCRAAGGSRKLLERSLANSLAFAILDPGGATAEFGRIVADRTIRAHIADVMLSVARGAGLGRGLVAAMLDHPELAIWTLTTADAHGLYSCLGFRSSAGDPNWMVLHRCVT